MRKIDNVSFVSLDNAPSQNLRIWLLMRLENGVICFLYKNSFSIYFWPKKPGKHPKNLVKSIHSLQKHKKIDPKSKIKYLHELKSVFLYVFKIKKILNHNPLHYMESFNTTIYNFGDLNPFQHQLSISNLDFRNPSHIHIKKNLKKEDKI